MQLVSGRRRRPVWPSGTLLMFCITMIGVSMWLRPEPWQLLFGVRRTQVFAASISQREDQRPVCMKTQTRGLLDLDQEDSTKYLMVQCHRGQFSNRLMCLKSGVLLARALGRVLVIPMFTDVTPVVDVSKYVSLQCLRRNNQAITFEEFREQTCRGVGLGVPRLGATLEVDAQKPGKRRSTSGGANASSLHVAAGGGEQRKERDKDKKGAGSFCAEGAVLYVEDGYSLSDYRGYNCWNRREDLTNARDLGVEVGRCSHVQPVDLNDAGKPYRLADIRDRFANLPDKVLLFLDLFGVNLLPGGDDLDQTVDEPGQMCGWMPTEAAAGAADAVMQMLIPPATHSRHIGVASAGTDGAVAAAFGAIGGGNDAEVSNGRALDPRNLMDSVQDTAHVSESDSAASGAGMVSARIMAAAGGTTGGSGLAVTSSSTGSSHLLQELPERPPPVRLRGVRRYAALHLRRSDWFYYCGGARRCFYSMTEAGSWLNATLASQGLDTLYVSTNADDREKQMLRRAVSGRVLFWEDVLAQLRSWQVQALEMGQDDATGASAAASSFSSSASASSSSASSALTQLPPTWVSSLPLDDELMVQMVEKSICMQASFFISSSKSTFSRQIRDFRHGGLEPTEREVLVRKFGESAVSEAAAVATAGLPGHTHPRHSASAMSSTTGASTASGASTFITSGVGLTATSFGSAGLSAGDTSGGHPASSLETSTYLCDRMPPHFPDIRRLPDVHNPQILVEQLRTLADSFLQVGAGAWRSLVGGPSHSHRHAAGGGQPSAGGSGEQGQVAAAALAAPAAAVVSTNARPEFDDEGDLLVPGRAPQLSAGTLEHASRAATYARLAAGEGRPDGAAREFSGPSFWGALTAPWRALQRLVLLVEDGHAMAAANRFVDMYTSGAVAGLVLEGTQHASAAALADCVEAAVSGVGAEALHVSMVDVPEEQQVLLMQELESRGALRQITRIGGAKQERGSTFTLLWRGDGLGRHAEPALLEELPTFLERVDSYVLTKALVLLGDRRGVLFRNVEHTRRLYGFADPRDGSCGPERLQ